MKDTELCGPLYIVFLSIFNFFNPLTANKPWFFIDNRCDKFYTCPLLLKKAGFIQTSNGNRYNPNMERR